MFEFYLFKYMTFLFTLFYFLDDLFHISFITNYIYITFFRRKKENENTTILSTKSVICFTSPNRFKEINKQELKNFFLEDIQHKNIWEEIRKRVKKYNHSLIIGDILEVHYSVPYTVSKKEKSEPLEEK